MTRYMIPAGNGFEIAKPFDNMMFTRRDHDTAVDITEEHKGYLYGTLVDNPLVQVRIALVLRPYLINVDEPGTCRVCGGKYMEKIDGRPPAVVAILPWQTICYRCAKDEDRKQEAKFDEAWRLESLASDQRIREDG